MDTLNSARTDLSYRGRGMVMETMPIPAIKENCRSIPAGPVIFVVESRLLNEGTIGDYISRQVSEEISIGTDAGASLHVYGAADGLEYLRFDCFEKQPHYHYIHQDKGLNEVLMIDNVAVDPISWALFCIRNRLPEMLDYTGAKSVAADVRSQSAAVAHALDRISEIIDRISV